MFHDHKKEYMQILENVMERGAFIMQKDLSEFEESLASYLGVRHAVGVADGTIALKISLILAGIGDGDEVIIPSHTFIATASAVNQIGGIPVLCDCLSDSMIDIESAKNVVTSKTKAIMPVQLNGRTAEMDDVMIFADAHGLKIVEDSCQALGAKYKDRYAGTFGVAGSFSFYPAKTLGCFGDGGALVLDDDENADHARMLRDHGRDADGIVRCFGVNGRLDNIQAAILSAKLKRYDKSLQKRRHLAKIYNDRLGGLGELILPPGPNADNSRYDIYQNYEIQAESREGLRKALSNSGVGTILQWGGRMIHQFGDLNLRSHSPYADKMSKRFMLLPMHPWLEADDIDYVCDTIEQYYK